MPKETNQPEIRRRLNDIACAINERLPEGHGFIVLTFKFDPGGSLNYASNADRKDCIAVLKEFLIKTGAAEDWMKHIS